MSYVSKLSCWFASAAVLVAVVGCGSKPATQKSGTPASNQAKIESEEEEIAAVLAGLSAEDRELVVKQRVCPVSDSRLGTRVMGVPQKVEVKGNTVFICCEHCRDALVNEPDKHLAKLGIATDGMPAAK